MERTDWFLALISVLVAVVALETASDATSEFFRDLAGGLSAMVIVLVPVYLLVQVAAAWVGE